MKEQKKRSFNTFLARLRAEHGLEVVTSLRSLVQALKNDCLIGMVMDHGAEDDASIIRFFSHDVPTPGGAVYLSEKFNKPIYPCFSYRNAGFNHIVLVGEPLATDGKDRATILRELNKIYEEYLTEHPADYYWYFKRFKYKRNRDVLIVSDSKIGHVKQAKAFAALLPQQETIRTRCVDIRYRHPACRHIADIFAFLSGKRFPSYHWLIPLLVTPESWRALDSSYGDIVIGAGSYIAPLVKLQATVLGAKSVAVLRPNIALRKFDMAVIPEHDRIFADNAVMVKGALFSPEELTRKVDACTEFFRLGNDKKIAVFIGGPLSDTREFIANTQLFLAQLKQFSLSYGYKLLISTSRRTVPEIERYLEKEFSAFKMTAAIVIVSRKNYDFVFDGFAKIASMVFVSSDSISMVSEAAALNTSCICVSLETDDDKRQVFFDSIREQVTFLHKPYEMRTVEPKTTSLYERNRMIVQTAAQKLL